MKTTPHHSRRSDPDRYTAAVFHWLFWAAYLVAKLGAPKRSKRLKSYIRECEKFLEHVLFLHAVRRVRRVGRAERLNPTAGFRVVRSASRLVYKTARIRARGKSLRQRAERLLAVFANAERYIARFYRRVRNGLHSARLIAPRPPADACRSAEPRAIACADSS